MKNFINRKTGDGRIGFLGCRYGERSFRMEFTHTGTEYSPGNRNKDVHLHKRQQHSHPVYHIVLFTEGNFHFFQNNRKVDFSPGTVTVTNPDEIHKFGWFEVIEPNCYSYLTFQLLDMKTEQPLTIPFNELLEIYSGVNIPEISWPVVLGKTQSNYIENAISKITELLNSGGGYLSSLTAGITTLEVFKIIIQECFYVGKTDIDIPRNTIPEEKVKEFIETNFREELTIKDLSKIAALESNYLIRKFKKEYNTTPINYQIELKINAAKTLLRTTDFRIKRIANETGFTDIYYFSRQFKKHTGMTPTQFRHHG